MKNNRYLIFIPCLTVEARLIYHLSMINGKFLNNDNWNYRILQFKKRVQQNRWFDLIRNQIIKVTIIIDNNFIFYSCYNNVLNRSDIFLLRYFKFLQKPPISKIHLSKLI